MDEVENFFCQFPNPWALRVSGMGGSTSKCEKSQNHCTLMSISEMHGGADTDSLPIEDFCIPSLLNQPRPAVVPLQLCTSLHLKVVGNENGGGSGNKLLLENGFGPWRSMSV